MSKRDNFGTVWLPDGPAKMTNIFERKLLNLSEGSSFWIKMTFLDWKYGSTWHQSCTYFFHCYCRQISLSVCLYLASIFNLVQYFLVGCGLNQCNLLYLCRCRLWPCQQLAYRGPMFKKNLRPYVINFGNKLDSLFLTSFPSPSLMSVGKARSLPQRCSK
jgi:hypothetical protein